MNRAETKKLAMKRKERKKRKEKEAEEKKNLDEENQKRLQELDRVHSKEEIDDQLKTCQGEIATDIDQTQYQIDNCHDDQLEDLEKQMMGLKQLMKEIYPSDEEEGATTEEDEKSQEDKEDEDEEEEAEEEKEGEEKVGDETRGWRVRNKFRRPQVSTIVM